MLIAWRKRCPPSSVPRRAVRQLHIELIDDRGGLQKLDHRLGLLLENLSDEKVSHDSLAPRESSDERGGSGSFWRDSAANRTPASHPSVRLDRVATSSDERTRPKCSMRAPASFSLQPEVSLADLSQSSLGPPTVERQRGIDPARDDDVLGRRESLDKGGQSALGGGSDDVEVIEDQPRRSRPESQLVDQGGDHVFDVVWALDEEVERVGY